MITETTVNETKTTIFKTKSSAEYIYDDKTGARFPVNEVLKKAIDLCSKFSLKEVQAQLIKEYQKISVDGALKFIERWRKTYGGFYSSASENNEIRKNLESIKSIKPEDLKDQFLRSPHLARQLILNVTEDCNLRCKYCIYSDNYKLTRKPSKNVMTLETGKKAIDYFFKLNEKLASRNPGKKISIGFYGGEPLLSLSTIDKLVQYAQKNTPLHLSFHMTTNGMLLNDEVADFIVKNKIMLAISLDGDKENHDRNRVTVNGRGSFDIVYNNIKRFLERHSDYAERFGFVCVYDWNIDLEAVERFFEDNRLNVMFVDSVLYSSGEGNYYDRFTEREKKRFIKQNNHMRKKFTNNLMNRKTPTLFSLRYLNAQYLSIFIHLRVFDKRMKMIPFTGACMPGIKISVRSDGIFDMCERVNATMPIGNVETGLDWNAIANIIRKYTSALGDKCLSCPFTRMCEFCYGDGNSMRNTSFLFPEDRCKFIQKCRADALSWLYSILETDPNAFDWLTDYLKRPEGEYFF